MKIEKALRKYLEQNTRVNSPSTLNHYSITIRQWQQLHGGKVKSLTDENLAAFMRWLQTEGKSVATVNQKRSYICAFWRWLADRGCIKRRPTISALPEPERIPVAWTRDEMDRLFRACKAMRGRVCHIPAGAWWYSIHLLWFYTGERISASLAAKWANYDGSTLVIPAEDRKGKHHGMVYELVPDLVKAIEDIRQPERELIWPWELHITRIYQVYHRLLRDAGIARVKWKTGPHKMRRSYASYLQAAGGDATEGLMHSSSALTRKSYLDPKIAKRPNQSVLLPKVG